MLELLYILEVGLYKINIEMDKSDYKEELVDLMENYKVLIRVVMGKIEPSIKHKIQKSGITVIHNTYTGYDSEFQNIDLKYNELLSVQLAVNTKVSLKMPLVKDYEFSKIDTLTGKVYQIKIESESVIKYGEILKLLNDGIKSIRFLKYNSYDNSISKIINNLKLKRVPCVEVEEKSSIIFNFERTPIETWFKLIDEEGMSFKELVRKSNEIAFKKRELEWSRILNILKDIHNDKDFQTREESVNLVSDLVNNVRKGNLETDSDSETVNETNSIKPNKLKQFTRTKMQSFSNNVISVTEVKNNYFIGHLTSADLSILKDFDEIKESLDIVNGSFVTIGKPILIDNVNVSLRDTMLLAPGSKKTLAAIGSLYDKKLNKIFIGDRIKNMKLFLKEDPVLFEEYALQDALITLIHACFMEDFNFRTGSVGIPLTLSTLSRNYILNK
ncbi:hypothetical protein OCU04_013252 [Sclerotinia nivalis]|uniref:Uncharacterized protein n=1 Tax=Sclerotinia nivalis TaxID=352851 RepID=A0A9X0ABH5_9HELO|nr:hypothetical protein OCU04_013250 [Sclerotinia nivalis]KAJ8057808.1 hypothetical protein OCU04_013251 [Sclerotinia nivalis]KAJ8057809.1 hypothetical protein OCU04_013252 [Sclerotinia nivalis]